MPATKVLEEKKAIVAELAEKMKNSSSGVLVDYKGITVEQDTMLRRQLRNAGVDYAVVKNTLTRFAATDAGLEGIVPVLEGTTALAISPKDPVAAAKVLYEFIKKNNKLTIKAGFVEGKVLSATDVENLAQLPPKEVLIAKMLGSLNAPISGFVTVLNGNIRGLVVALNAIAEKKS